MIVELALLVSSASSLALLAAQLYPRNPLAPGYRLDVELDRTVDQAAAFAASLAAVPVRRLDSTLACVAALLVVVATVSLASVAWWAVIPFARWRRRVQFRRRIPRARIRR